MGALGDAGVKLLDYAATVDALESAKPAEATYRVSASTDYAVHVEFGTKHAPAQPYMRPAVNQVMRNAERYASSADDTDELVESIAEAIADKARGKAPVDTGTLRDSITVEEL